jgi:hypothetical protein
MRFYTVVLLYPDYLTGDFGADIYVDAARAKNLERAVRAVQWRAVRAQLPDSVNDPSDFRPILVLAGDVKVVADATSF